MRLFIGIPLTQQVSGELSALVARLRSGSKALQSTTLRWTAPDSWHITLQFLGNATADQLQCLTTRLAEVRPLPVPVHLGELGAFDRAGVFFVDVIVSPGLRALEERVVAATGQCGFAPETRQYHPHITLARAKGQWGTELRDLRARIRASHAFSSFTAHEFLLYQSHLGPQGSRYEVRGRFPLGPGH